MKTPLTLRDAAGNITSVTQTGWWEIDTVLGFKVPTPCVDRELPDGRKTTGFVQPGETIIEPTFDEVESAALRSGFRALKESENQSDFMKKYRFTSLPELYAALDALMKDCLPNDPIRQAPSMENINNARKALSKARGEI